MNDLLQYIYKNRNIRFGKPCIINTRITVDDIIQWLDSGMSDAEILQDHPELKEIHIQAAFYYNLAGDEDDEQDYYHILLSDIAKDETRRMDSETDGFWRWNID